MKTLFTLFFLLSVGILNAQLWTSVPGNSIQGNFTETQDITVLDNGHLILAYSYNDSPGYVYVEEWDGQQWTYLPEIMSITMADRDLNLVSIGNDIYVGIGGSDAPMIDYQVFKFNGSGWDGLDLNSLTTLNYLNGTVKLSGSDQTDDLVLSYHSPDGFAGDLPNLCHFNGSTWDMNYGQELRDSFDFPTGEYGIITSEVFHNGSNTYFLDKNTEAGGGGALKTTNPNGNNQIQANGYDELRLWQFEANWQGLYYPNPAGTFYIQDNPNLLNMDGHQAGGQPTIAYTSYWSPNEVVVSNIDAGNNYQNISSYFASAEVAQLDIKLDNNGLPYIAVNDINNANKVLHFNGSGWDQIGADFSGLSTNSFDLEVNKANNKIYLLYRTDGGSELITFNTAPTPNAYTINPVCGVNTPSIAINSINFTDVDMDSVYIESISSSDAGILQGSNAVFTRTNAYSQTSPDNIYQLEVTPENGSSGTVVLTVSYSDGITTVSENITITVNPTPTVSGVADQVVCLGDNFSDVSFTGTGSTFDWTNDNTSIGLAASGTGMILSFSPTNSGAANISVTSTQGTCTSAPVTFSLEALPLDDAGFNYSNNTFCLNATNESPSINLMGGTFTNSVISGGNISVNNSSGLIDFSSSTAGVYTVTYTTVGTCPNTSTETITILDLPNVTAQNTTVCLNNGPLNMESLVSPVGGIANNQFIGNNAFNPLNAGEGVFNYTYTYTDLNGCSNQSSASITVNEIPSVNLAVTNTSCGSSDGAVDATIFSTVGVSNVFWSSGQITEDIAFLSPNNYYINVTDNNGCYVMEVATVTGSTMNITGNVTHNNCFGESNGAIDLTVSGGDAPYTFYWSNGSTSEDINNLLSGQYEVFVYDANGCMSTMSFNVNQPNEISNSFSTITPSACGLNDGEISTNVLGGTAPYSFEWSDNTGSPVGTGTPLSNVGGGVYTLNITDINGCALSSDVSVSENGGPTVVLNQISPASCNNDGFVDVTVASSAAIQSTNWTNGSTTQDISNLSPGTYNLTVTDVNGCESNLTALVPPLLPEVNNICLVTVDTNTNTNLIVWEKPVTTDIHSFIIYRETSVAGEFLPVDTVSYADESIFTDPIAYPQIRSWRYKLTTVNNCGVESHFSPVHKTIHVTTTPGTGGNYNISWDQYEGFSYSTFDIYRHTDELGWEATPIASLPANLFSYTDTPPSTNGVDYMIAVTPPTICTSSKAQDWNSSRSNKTSSTSSAPGNPLNVVNVTASTFELSIYPNPSSGIFNVNISGMDQAYTINVFDMSGKLISTVTTANQQFSIDLSHVESGMYIVEINTENEVMREQIIKG
ncbi:MAG: T9SS type A sorting domain-containing protein [Putridiphycobacter sp.]